MTKDGAQEGPLDEYAAGLLQRIRKQKAEDLLRSDRLREAAKVVAARLAKDFGVRRVWLFGSLAWGEGHSQSDIDLLVEGLSNEHWSAASAAAEAEANVSVDLVRVEEAAPELLKRVREEGWVLYGAG
jgi:predicted nucleotidyltransferase